MTEKNDFMPVSISYDFIQFQSENLISDRKMNASREETLVIKEPWSLKNGDRDDVHGNYRFIVNNSGVSA